MRLRKSFRREWIRNKWVYLMVAPVTIYYMLFKYVPMGYLAMSFYDFKILKGFEGSKFVGLKHYIDFFSGSNFVPAFNQYCNI